jgi:hypothetical protein
MGWMAAHMVSGEIVEDRGRRQVTQRIMDMESDPDAWHFEMTRLDPMAGPRTLPRRPMRG